MLDHEALGVETDCVCVPGDVEPCSIMVRCGAAEAFAPDAESALVAARELLLDAAAAPASRHGRYCTVSFYSADGDLIGAMDQSTLVGACRHYLTVGGAA